MSSQVLYLVLGLAGLPVFAASPDAAAGVRAPARPDRRLPLSYPFAAFVAGWLAERSFDRRYLTSLVAMAAGLAIVFACGVAWLAWFAQPAASASSAALRTGLVPFLPADVIKVVARRDRAARGWRSSALSRLPSRLTGRPRLRLPASALPHVAQTAQPIDHFLIERLPGRAPRPPPTGRPYVDT